MPSGTVFGYSTLGITGSAKSSYIGKWGGQTSPQHILTRAITGVSSYSMTAEILFLVPWRPRDALIG
ncbi:hypothetical protein IG631_00912 [Alternaria alternata]|nr:hypothetical protein IG631_00912 [Alternaria alternata]